MTKSAFITFKFFVMLASFFLRWDNKFCLWCGGAAHSAAFKIIFNKEYRLVTLTSAEQAFAVMRFLKPFRGASVSKSFDPIE
jgi:hypothetical protein